MNIKRINGKFVIAADKPASVMLAAKAAFCNVGKHRATIKKKKRLK